MIIAKKMQPNIIDGYILDVNINYHIYLKTSGDKLINDNNSCLVDCCCREGGSCFYFF